MSPPAEPIRSSTNPLLKRVRAAAAGRGEGELLLEGDRLVDEARRAGLALAVVLVAEARVERRAELENAGLSVRVVRDELLAAVSTLEHAPGCVALVTKPPARTLAGLEAGPDALFAIAAGIQDPGNLGALARTAEAAGAAALLVVRGGCGPWNAKALRGSMGSLLRLPVAEIEADESSVEALTRRGFRHVRARTRGGRSFGTFDWTGRIALWLTAESGELAPGLAAASEDFEGVSIPMRGPAESLNVNAAAAVLLYAAGRNGDSR